jgi:hypothetical protein
MARMRPPLRIANRGDRTPAPLSGASVSDVEKLLRNQTHRASRQQQRIATPHVPATVKAQTVAEEGRAGLVQSTSSLRNPLRCGRPTRDRLWCAARRSPVVTRTIAVGREYFGVHQVIEFAAVGEHAGTRRTDR